MTEKEIKRKKRNLLIILKEYKGRMFKHTKGLQDLQPFENYTAEDISMMKKINSQVDKFLERAAKERE